MENNKTKFENITLIFEHAKKMVEQGVSEGLNMSPLNALMNGVALMVEYLWKQGREDSWIDICNLYDELYEMGALNDDDNK